ncbi:hypothetical protein C0992_009602 [Termitomyces sp. T32_za158]|nr:hypothetical protein C0992_009602 [Termitomyces sp. T32_za158]
MIEAILLIDTETMLAKNSLQAGEGDWTFGQTLAVFVLLAPLRDLIGAVTEEGAKQQRQRLLLNVVNGIEGVIQVLLGFGVESEDLSKKLAGIKLECSGHFKIVDFLLRESKDQINIEGEDKEGRTALHHAVSRKKGTALRRVTMPTEHNTEAGVDPLLPEGRTTRHCAGGRVKLRIVERLLEQNANPKAKDKTGRTPLHYAADDGRADIVKTLLECQADPNLKDYKGRTALDLAESKLDDLADVSDSDSERDADKYRSIVQMLE